MSEATETLLVWEDIGFCAFMDAKSHHADFSLYNTESLLNDLRPGTVGDVGDDARLAEIMRNGNALITGSVKWDGCSNWHPGEDFANCFHGCERQHLVNLGEALARCWDAASKAIPTWDG